MRADGHPGGAEDVTSLFAAVAGIGPFFAVAVGPEPAGGGWVRLRDLCRGAGADDPLTARIAAVGTALATDARVAASTAFQGLAAQLVAPLFAAAAVEGVLPAPAGVRATEDVAGALYWRPAGPGPWLWWRGTGGRIVPAADDGLPVLLVGLLAPLVAEVRARVPVAERVLWGNVASAVASARGLVVAARPDTAARAAAAAERVLAAPPLAATAAFRPAEPPDRGWTFRRRSCCLYYRVPGGGICGDCVLHDRPARTGGGVGPGVGPRVRGGSAPQQGTAEIHRWDD